VLNSPEGVPLEWGGQAGLTQQGIFFAFYQRSAGGLSRLRNGAQHPKGLAFTSSEARATFAKKNALLFRSLRVYEGALLKEII
jgi:hypothetical protein